MDDKLTLDDVKLLLQDALLRMDSSTPLYKELKEKGAFWLRIPEDKMFESMEELLDSAIHLAKTKNKPVFLMYRRILCILHEKSNAKDLVNSFMKNDASLSVDENGEFITEL